MLLHKNHPHFVKALVTTGICAITAVAVFVPELYSHGFVISAQLGINILWVWGDEL